MPAEVATSRSTKSVIAYAGERDDAGFFAVSSCAAVTLPERDAMQDFGVGQMLLVFRGAGGDDFPAGLRFQNIDSRCAQRFRDYDFHGSLNRHWLLLGGVVLLDRRDARA